MDFCNSFIADLAQFKPISSAKYSAVEIWEEDIPFLLLCAEIGKAIVNSFDLFSEKEKAYIFRAIETGISSEDKELSVAIATGLLESMYVKAEKNPLLLARIDAQLGRKTKDYLSAWIKWQT